MSSDLSREDLLKPIRTITLNYKNVKRSRFLGELFLTAIFGWSLFFYGSTFPLFSLKQILIMIPTTFIIYRGAIFIHELAHFRKKVEGFETWYNILFGYACNFPSYIYETHLYHHGMRSFGTSEDPEYKNMNYHSKWRILDPILNSLFLPFFGIVRFGILPLITPFLPRIAKEKIYLHASTLVMESKYLRPYKSAKELNMMMKNDLLCSLYKIVPIVLVYLGVLNVSVLIWWSIMIVIASALNMYRAKFNHKYFNEGQTMSDLRHMLDCITIEGSWVSELWAPLGLRFHTLHHVVQDIPYYNLKAAHKKLMLELPEGHPYRETVVPNFKTAAIEYWKSHSKSGPAYAI